MHQNCFLPGLFPTFLLLLISASTLFWNDGRAAEGALSWEVNEGRKPLLKHDDRMGASSSSTSEKSTYYAPAHVESVVDTSRIVYPGEKPSNLPEVDSTQVLQQEKVNPKQISINEQGMVQEFDPEAVFDPSKAVSSAKADPTYKVISFDAKKKPKRVRRAKKQRKKESETEKAIQREKPKCECVL